MDYITYPEYIVALKNKEDKDVVRQFMQLNGVKKVTKKYYLMGDAADHYKGKCYTMSRGRVRIYDKNIMLLFKLTCAEVIESWFEMIGGVSVMQIIEMNDVMSMFD